jgi:octaprenyl-diphosphate synthase
MLDPSIYELVQDDLVIVEKIIMKDLDPHIEIINQVSRHIIGSGGKRLRPMLTILFGRLVTQPSDMLYKMAAMIEYIHVATLLHDDVVDWSVVRRGADSANAKFGDNMSVLVGDFIYTRAFQMMVASNSMAILSVMADATNKISSGEIMQHINIGNVDITLQQYLDTIYLKTAVLFEAAATIALLAVCASDTLVERLPKYAYHLGIGFQIMDDMLDYIADSSDLGKKLGGDLLDGKITLPLIRLLEVASLNDVNLVKSIIINRNCNLEKFMVGFGQICDMFKSYNVIDYCYQVVQFHVNEAINSLSIVEESLQQHALISLASNMLVRLNKYAAF